MKKDTICAISTPVGEAGIGIVRLSGKKALKIADEIFMPKNGKRPSQLPGYTVHYGHIVKKSKISLGLLGTPRRRIPSECEGKSQKKRLRTPDSRHRRGSPKAARLRNYR